LNKFILGGAQFGQNNYGINSLNGNIKISEMKLILKHAKKNNINFIDTAISYGLSEKNLGKIGVNDFKIISKLPKLPAGISDVRIWVKEQIESSLKRLNEKKLYGLLLHNPYDLIGPHRDTLISILNELKSLELVKKIGVSIYDPKELEKIISFCKIEIVQAPLNIIDRRLEKSGWLLRLHNQGTEVHVRSVFLQGLLLMKKNEISPKFKRWSLKWDKWNLKLEQQGISALSACLHYPLSLKKIDRIIIGVDNVLQLKKIIAASKIKIPKTDLSFMQSNDLMLINPSNWKNL
jgi:aryl-alcohol dehydrogenase-like predicted oxidoreductase